MSQLRYIRDTGLDRTVTLIWGNKTQDDICFAEELEAMKQEIAHFDIVHVMSHQDDWQGEKGFITEDIIRRSVDDVQAATYFVCGPPVMMNVVIPMIEGMGIPRERVRYERFALG
jgi:3-phenylpropionate/trans-cinnamate dioxygenase ferredoxin reductase subunit